jgi:hypothetical protein
MIGSIASLISDLAGLLGGARRLVWQALAGRQQQAKTTEPRDHALDEPVSGRASCSSVFYTPSCFQISSIFS